MVDQAGAHDAHLEEALLRTRGECASDVPKRDLERAPLTGLHPLLVHSHPHLLCQPTDFSHAVPSREQMKPTVRLLYYADRPPSPERVIESEGQDGGNNKLPQGEVGD